MLQKLKNKLLLVAGFLLVSSFSAPVAVYAVDYSGSLCHGAATQQIGTGDCNKIQDQTGTINGLITTIINLFSAIIGIIAVIMIIVGGFRYITSGGNSETVGKAKNTILYAIIGLIIVALARVIVQFVLNKTT